TAPSRSSPMACSTPSISTSGAARTWWSMPGEATTLRRNSGPGDWGAIAAIQRSSPEAAAWDPAGYDVTVAEIEGCVVGFLVTRKVAEGEFEILNLAVAPAQRRRGVAKALVEPLLETAHGDVFLEVRESNLRAR